MRTVLVLLSLCSCLMGVAQNAPVITYKEYIQTVREHHPLARIADIRLESGEAMLRTARGAFDPKIQGSLNRKDFDGSRYYDLLQGGVKIPTWMGITIVGGYSQNEGIYLNPEELTPNQGLFNAGLSLTLGKGLFVDERRAGLLKAELALDMADLERTLLLNELLLDAGAAYWNWFQAHHAAEVYEEVLALSQERFEAVSQSAVLGDRPYIDTLEASIQFQTRSLQFQEATLAKQNAAAAMSVYLWLEGELPMIIDSRSEPAPIDLYPAIPADPLLMVELDEAINGHPLLGAKALYIDRLRVEQSWKREQLKPQVDLKYNALTESVGGTEINGFNANNYTLGVEVSMPILLRKERGELELNSLKIEQKEMSLVIKRQDLWLKARQSLNQWDLFSRQLDLYEGTARDYAALLDGDRELFRQGESSLFLVNRRETSYVNAQVKLIELKAKNRMAELKTRFAMADLDLDL